MNSWTSRKELISCAIASAYVPFIIGKNIVDPHYLCIDGWMSIDLKNITREMITTRNNKSKINSIDQFFHISIAEAFRLFKDGMNYNTVYL